MTGPGEKSSERVPLTPGLSVYRDNGKARARAKGTARDLRTTPRFVLGQVFRALPQDVSIAFGLKQTLNEQKRSRTSAGPRGGDPTSVQQHFMAAQFGEPSNDALVSAKSPALAGGPAMVRRPAALIPHQGRV